MATALAMAMARVERAIANIPQQRSAQGLNTFSIASPTVSRQAVGVPAATTRRRRGGVERAWGRVRPTVHCVNSVLSQNSVPSTP